MLDIYFDSAKLPEPKSEYVAFIDLMGIQNRMKFSVHQSANFIFKLHSALLSAKHRCCKGRIALYPIMDGAYISTPQYKDMEEYLTRVFGSLADLVVRESTEHVFIPRAGVAHGGVIHGYNVPYEASFVFEQEVGYKEKIMLGPAM